MNSEATVTTLLDAGAVLNVRDGKLVIHTESALPDEVLALLREDRDTIIEFWQERAAIREFDGGYQQSEAETLASKDLLCLD